MQYTWVAKHRSFTSGRVVNWSLMNPSNPDWVVFRTLRSLIPELMTGDPVLRQKVRGEVIKKTVPSYCLALRILVIKTWHTTFVQRATSLPVFSLSLSPLKST